MLRKVKGVKMGCLHCYGVWSKLHENQPACVCMIDVLGAGRMDSRTHIGSWVLKTKLCFFRKPRESDRSTKTPSMVVIEIIL
jgi:hypothetical protein